LIAHDEESDIEAALQSLVGVVEKIVDSSIRWGHPLCY